MQEAEPTPTATVGRARATGRVRPGRRGRRPGRQAHDRREGKVDLAERDDEDQRDSEEEQDRQRHEHRRVGPRVKTRGLPPMKIAIMTTKTAERAEGGAVARMPQRQTGRRMGLARSAIVATLSAPSPPRRASRDVRRPPSVRSAPRRRSPTCRSRARPAAVEHDEAVGDVVNVVDGVRDEDGRRASSRALLDELDHLPCLGQRERGRRLVEDDQVGLEVEARAIATPSRSPPESRPTFDSGEKTWDVKPIAASAVLPPRAPRGA